MSEEYDQSKGGGQWGEDDGPNIRYDDFVGRIVQDPNEPPCLTLLSGYLGASSEEGHVRLYLDEELCRYVEIPEKAIRHTRELPPEQSALGGSLVWIERDAEVLHGAAGSERRKATFLEGQIAQDYMGGTDYASTGITTQTKDCLAGGGGGAGILPTDMGPGCGISSQYKFCPQPTQQVYCRTLTGILCTRFAPLCRRTVFEPACTFAGPLCGKSVYYPCVTQNDSICVATGGVPCYPPIDFTIYEQPDIGQQQQFGQQAAFAGGGGVAARQAVGGVGGFDPTFTVFQTGFNCPSVFDNCATVTDSFCPTRLPGCGFTRFGCPPSVFIRCPTPFCPTRVCQTRTGPRCLISQVAVCNTVVCQFESAACGVDPAGGGVFQQRQAQADFAAAPGVGGVAAIPPTRICPSQVSICPSQIIVLCQSRPIIRCRTHNPLQCFPTWFVICNPTQYQCPTLPPGCGEPTGFTGQCETFGGCPSAVDACPTRFGCESQAACFQTQGCFPGGGGGFDPAAGGGGVEALAAAPGAAAGGAGAVGNLPQTAFCFSQFIRCPSPSQLLRCPSQPINRCPSAFDACPTRFNCPTRPPMCPSPSNTQYGVCETYGPCPSAVDACPSRFGCESQAGCFESQGCFPGGGFDPGRGGFGGGF